MAHIVFQPSGAKDLVKELIAYFSTFGVSAELGSDGGPEFTAQETAAFLDRWGVCHRLSAAYNHESNGRAEVAVKSMKQLFTSHTDAQGRLDTEAVAAGLLQYRNTPDPDSGLSPGQIIFGKPMRDLMPVMPEAPVFTNSAVHPLWHETWAKQEDLLRLRFARQAESRHHGSKAQPPLIPGDRVLMQNQAGDSQAQQMGQNWNHCRGEATWPACCVCRRVWSSDVGQQTISEESGPNLRPSPSPWCPNLILTCDPDCAHLFPCTQWPAHPNGPGQSTPATPIHFTMPYASHPHGCSSDIHVHWSSLLGRRYGSYGCWA